MAKTLIGAAVAAVLTVVLLTVLDVLSLAERVGVALVVFCAIIATSVVIRLVDREAAGAAAPDSAEMTAPGPLRDARLHMLRSQVSELRQEVSEHGTRGTLQQYTPRLLAEAAQLQAGVEALVVQRDAAQPATAEEREAGAVYDAQLRLLREELKALHAEIARHSAVREGSSP